LSIDFSTEEQVASRMRDQVRLRELNNGVVDRDQKSEFSLENWRKCAQFGIQGLPIPEEYGGSGADVMTTLLAMEGLGYGCRDNGLIFAINAQMWAVELPILFLHCEQKRSIYQACAVVK
jgi:alkylation response protein AidB-like acyl-CoA dehydrogenase